MPKIASELGALAVKRLNRRGLHAVGGVPGLALRVSDTGARSWVLRVVVGAKRREMGLGGYPAVTLADAQRLAREAREAVSKGIDPVREREESRSALRADAAAAITFQTWAAQ
jgi:hypothetical protein